MTQRELVWIVMIAGVIFAGEAQRLWSTANSLEFLIVVLVWKLDGVTRRLRALEGVSGVVADDLARRRSPRPWEHAD